MVTPSSNAIATNRYGDIYTPQIWVNDTNGVVINGNSISSQESISNLRNLIVSSNSSTLVFIDGKIIEKTNGKERVKTGVKVKNLDTTNNDYFLSCYLMQNGILYAQQGSNANPTTHNFVIIRDLGTFWGEKVIWNNDLFEIIYSFENNVLNSDHHFVVILWQKSNNRYSPLGGFKFE
jgi:hypothetical protein